RRVLHDEPVHSGRARLCGRHQLAGHPDRRGASGGPDDQVRDRGTDQTGVRGGRGRRGLFRVAGRLRRAGPACSISRAIAPPATAAPYASICRIATPWGGSAVSNFAFLRDGWPDIFAEAVRAERSAVADPRTSCFYAR